MYSKHKWLLTTWGTNYNSSS